MRVLPSLRTNLATKGGYCSCRAKTSDARQTNPRSLQNTVKTTAVDTTTFASNTSRVNVLQTVAQTTMLSLP